MKKFLMAAVLGTLSLQASATVYTFNTEFSQSGFDCANTTFGCAALRTTAIADGVHFEFLGLMSGAEKITSLYGNISPYVEPTVLGLSGTGLDAVDGTFDFSLNGHKADGDGFFDWVLNFNSSPPTFNGSDLLEWDFLGVTLAQIDDAISVNGPAGKTGFHFAIHTQGLVDGGSGWFSGDPVCVTCPTPFDEPPNGVPEPGTLVLAGLALIGIVAGRHRKIGPEDEDEDDDDKEDDDAF